MTRQLFAAAKLRAAACSTGAVSAVHCRLGAEEFELGLGIHGEPGASRAKLRHVLLRLAPFGSWLGCCLLLEPLRAQPLGCIPPAGLFVLAGRCRELWMR